MMRHGIRIPDDKRPSLALRAYRLRCNGLTFEAIANQLDVSMPTARNLVGAGQQTTESGDAEKMNSDIRIDIARVFSNWMNPEYMKLHAGEMTAQEIRTVRAIVDVVRREIQDLLRSAPNGGVS